MNASVISINSDVVCLLVKEQFDVSSTKVPGLSTNQ